MTSIPTYLISSAADPETPGLKKIPFVLFTCFNVICLKYNHSVSVYIIPLLGFDSAGKISETTCSLHTRYKDTTSQAIGTGNKAEPKVRKCNELERVSIVR